MVLRKGKKSRKYLGTRSWGAGNIKNRRGAGDRGGVGRGGIKAKWTHKVVYEKDSIGKVGFSRWRATKLDEINLGGISKRLESVKEEKPKIELRGYKVLSNGVLAKPAEIKASGFSKKAVEKIRRAGGEAIKL